MASSWGEAADLDALDLDGFDNDGKDDAGGDDEEKKEQVEPHQQLGAKKKKETMTKDKDHSEPSSSQKLPLKARKTLTGLPELLAELLHEPSTAAFPQESACLFELFADGSRAALASRARLVVVAGSDTVRCSFDDESDDHVTALRWAQLAGRVVLIAGYASGIVRFIDERGEVMVSPRMHASRVRSIKAHASTVFSRPSLGVLVVQDRTVCYLDGVSLAESLLAPQTQRDDQRMAVRYHLWELYEQVSIHDADVCMDMIEDDLAPAKVRSMPRFIAAGTAPFVAFYRPHEEAAHSLTGMALKSTIEIASRLTSAVFSYAAGLFSGQHEPQAHQQQQQQQQQQQGTKTRTPTSLSFSRCLRDRARAIERVCVDPTQRFALLTDNYGRVLLMDVRRFIVLRLYKGYRDAQCAWIKPKRKTALYIVLHAPRRLTLEVWALHGARLGTSGTSPDVTLKHVTAKNESRAFLVHVDGHVDEVCPPQAAERAGRRSKKTRKRKKKTASLLRAAVVDDDDDDDGGDGDGGDEEKKEHDRPSTSAPHPHHHIRVDGVDANNDDGDGDGRPLPSGGAASVRLLEEELLSYTKQHRLCCLGVDCGVSPRLSQLEGLVQSGTADLPGLMRVLVGDAGLIPVEVKRKKKHQQGAAAAAATAADKRKQKKKKNPLSAHGLSQLSVKLCPRLAFATLSTAVEAVGRLDTAKKDVKTALAQLEACLALVRAHAAAQGVVEMRRGLSPLSADAEQERREQQEAERARPHTAMRPEDRVMDLCTFLTHFQISDSTYAILTLRVTLSVSQLGKLAEYLFAPSVTERPGVVAAASDLAVVRGVVKYLRQSQLQPRHTTNLFLRWFASLRPAQLGKQDALDARLRHSVRVLHEVHATTTYKFFDAVKRFADATTLFDRGTHLAGLCADAAEAAGEDAEWARGIASRLSLLQMVRSYLPNIDRTTCTIGKFFDSGDWPVTRLVAVQLLHTLSAKTAPVQARVTVRTVQLAQQQKNGDAEATSVDRFVDRRNVDALVHLLHPNFGLSGDGPTDTCSIVFYCALEALLRYQKTPQLYFLVAAIDHLEQLPPAPVSGALALRMWAAILSPIEAMLKTVADAPAATSSSATVTFVRAVRKQWSLAADSQRLIVDVGERLMRFIALCATEVKTEEEEKKKEEGEDGSRAQWPEDVKTREACTALFHRVAGDSEAVVETTQRFEAALGCLDAYVSGDLQVGFASVGMSDMFPDMPSWNKLLDSDKTDDGSGSGGGGGGKKGEQGVMVDAAGALEARRRFLFALLREKDGGRRALALAPRLALDLTAIRSEFITQLYESGRDAEAEEQLHVMSRRVSPELTACLLGVARTRLARFLSSLEAQSKPLYDRVVSSVPPDALHWFEDSSGWQPPARDEGAVSGRQQLRPLLDFVSRIQQLLPDGNVEQERYCAQLSLLTRAVETTLANVAKHR